MSINLQVISADQAGNVILWMLDTGQKVKQISQAHGQSEVTCLAQDHSQTRILTGSTDGTIKVGQKMQSFIRRLIVQSYRKNRKAR